MARNNERVSRIRLRVDVENPKPGYTAEDMVAARAVAAQIIRHYDLESSRRSSA